MGVLSVQKLSFAYEERRVLGRLDLEVGEGEVVVLLGPNGCGKTTLLDCIIGYRKYQAGGIRIYGKRDTEYTAADKAKRIAYVPQACASMFPFTALQIVLMGRTPHLKKLASPSAEDAEIARQALRDLGIEGFAGRPFTKLSGGEKQLVMIARAIAQDAQVILLDEPTSSLDVKNEMRVLRCVKDLVKKTGKSVVLATHQPNHAFYFENEGLRAKAAMFAGGTSTWTAWVGAST